MGWDWDPVAKYFIERDGNGIPFENWIWDGMGWDEVSWDWDGMGYS